MNAVLFYPSELVLAEVEHLVAFTVAPTDAPALDVIDFPDGGGTVERELAVPHLLGMDGVVVDDARLVLRSRALEVQAVAWEEHRRSEGHLVALEAPARVLAIVVDEPDPPPAAQPGTSLHTVLRPATRDGGGWTIGPPAFADPPFALGSMYPDALAGLGVHGEAGGRVRLTLPPTLAYGWVIAWAQGTGPTDLSPLPVTTTVRAVTVAATPADVSLALRPDPAIAGAAGGEVLLWSNPGDLTREAGAVTVDLGPMARKRLSDRLVVAGSTDAPAPTLSLPLRFTSASRGELAVEERVLDVRFTASGIGGEPLRTAVSAGWSAIELRAPAALRPASGCWRVAARHLGRELNGALPAAPAQPIGGMVVTADRWIATPLTIEPRSDASVDVDLVALQLRVSASTHAELVVELLDDPAGQPGASLGPPAVVSLDGEAVGASMIDVVLSGPVRVRAGGRVWVAARTNRGEVRWWGAPEEGEVRTSTDRGTSWQLADPRLGPVDTPEVRAFHAVADPGPVRLRVRVGSVPLPDVPLAPVGGNALELAYEGTVPDALLDDLGRRPGRGPVTTRAHLSSRAALDLTIADLTFTYEPTAGPTAT